MDKLIAVVVVGACAMLSCNRKTPSPEARFEGDCAPLVKHVKEMENPVPGVMDNISFNIGELCAAGRLRNLDVDCLLAAKDPLRLSGCTTAAANAIR